MRAFERHFEDFYVQGYTQIPSGYPAPNHLVWIRGDERLIRGFFTQRQTAETLIASAQNVRTHGQFTCRMDKDISPFTTLRRVSDSKFFAIQGDEIAMPKTAKQKLKVWVAAVIDRPQGMMTELEKAELSEQDVIELNRQYERLCGNGKHE